MGNEPQSKSHLERAVHIASDVASVQHALGLYWVRAKQLKKALHYLKAATKTNDRSLQYFYVYAIAQESDGQIDKAIETLKQANQLWPNQYNILMTLIQYLEKSGDTKQSLTYLSQLSAIAPADPQVIQRINRLKQAQ